MLRWRIMRQSFESPSLKRRREFLAAVSRSRELHGAWVTPPTTAKSFDAYVKRFSSPTHVAYWVRTESDELAAVINISEIVRGQFLSAYLGYYSFVPHNGRGHMTRALKTVIGRAFHIHGLHRLEANIQPGNEASVRLVRRLGFRKEGFSHRYLKIRGRWRDHERWALTAEDW
jgi:[ribosomal protein S5]-alanine N-acetyltransferase